MNKVKSRVEYIDVGLDKSDLHSSWYYSLDREAGFLQRDEKFLALFFYGYEN